MGDTVTLKSNRDEIQVRVTGLQHYGSFRDMIESVGLDALLSNTNSLEEGVQLYRSFSNYAEREKLYGCLAMYLEPV